MTRSNPSRRHMGIFLGVSALGGALALAPVVLGIDMSSGGGAMILLGIALIFVGILMALFLRKRAQILDRLLSEKDLLAHWTYTPDEWEAYAKKDLLFRSSHSKKTFFLIAFFAVLFGMVFFIADPEAGRFVALGLAAVMLLMAVVAKLSVDRARRRQTQEAKELLLSAEGLWLAGELHTWTVGGARLEGVTYAPEDRKILSFTYSTPGKNGPQYYTVRVLIPRGKEEEGAAVEAFFRDPERTRPQKGHRS
ncbi:MAG TPA: hypothetical protein PL162_08345 [Synergistaceae bacterium]|nr:hypothetical protein [Synergistaceae bacterium]